MRGVQAYISLFFMHFTAFIGKGRTKEQALKRNYEEASTSRTMARVEPPHPPPQVEHNARGTRVFRGLTHEQLALVDVYKSENLIGGKYFDPSVLRKFGFEDMVNRLLRHSQWRKVFEWRGLTYTPVTFEFLV